MKREKIWLSLAQMSGYEMQFIQSAFDTNWIAPLGPNVTDFEGRLERYVSNEKPSRVVALNTGTAALHLALLQLGVSSGDEVLCQSFTFAATANVITYLGAKPVFVDSEYLTWNMCPVMLEEAIRSRLEITGKKPKAILVVDLYGMPARMDKIMEVANYYQIPVVEDACEALGSKFQNQSCGTFGAFGALSFNGNKIITTSGGGALICNSDESARKTLFYATQARENEVHYQHNEIGYNYRMSNVSAGIGCGQMMALDSFVEARRRNHKLYSKLFSEVQGITVQENPSDDYESNFWLTCILIDERKFGKTADEIRILLENNNIESRPLWKPMHLQPVFEGMPFYGNNVSENLFKNGLCLPSGVGLTTENIYEIVDLILSDYPPVKKNEYARFKARELRYRPNSVESVPTLFVNRNNG
jgi:dTDP-4-amino-4,6-dideoxygalactose transaminase